MRGLQNILCNSYVDVTSISKSKSSEASGKFQWVRTISSYSVSRTQSS